MLSIVSSEIIPIAKKEAKRRAACIPKVADANADREIAEI